MVDSRGWPRWPPAADVGLALLVEGARVKLARSPRPQVVGGRSHSANTGRRPATPARLLRCVAVATPRARPGLPRRPPPRSVSTRES